MFERIKNNFQQFVVIWFVVLIANQVLIFGGCFAPYCLIAAIPHTLFIAVLIIFFWFKVDSDSTKKNGKSSAESPRQTYQPKPKPKPKPKPASNANKQSASKTYHEVDVENDVLKNRGDGYELHIGRKFELKGDLVIYNGFIRGYEDQGVDIVAISKNDQATNLIQCKHWKRYEFTVSHLEKIYDKLTDFSPDYRSIEPDTINQYLSIKYEKTDIVAGIYNSTNYQIRKALYLSSSDVIQAEVWPLLSKIKDNIYRYQDMKVVVHAI